MDVLLQDVGKEPGALPLLAHALLETWKRRPGRSLTLAGYAASGRMQGAITKTADEVYGQLTPEQQTIARNIFLRLTELGEGAQDTRRRVTLSELMPQDESAEGVRAVLQKLAGVGHQLAEAGRHAGHSQADAQRCKEQPNHKRQPRACLADVASPGRPRICGLCKRQALHAAYHSQNCQMVNTLEVCGSRSREGPRRYRF